MHEKRDSIDNSRLSDFETCPQLFDYKYNYELADESGHAARFSTFMIHKPVQAWWRAGGDYKPDWKGLMAQWAPTAEDMIADKFNAYTASTAELLFNQYVERTTELLDEYKFIEAEVYKTKPIGNIEQLWGSKTDIVLWHKATECKHVFEIKASKYNYILVGLNFNTQVLGEMFVNDACKGVVEFFWLNGKKSSFIRFELEPSAEEMNKWKKDTFFRVTNMYAAKVLNTYPRRESSCKRFNKECKFLDICNLGGPETDVGKNELTKYERCDSISYLYEA